MIYGMYDTQDNLWMGDENGPILFDSEKDPDPKIAQVRAQMLDTQLGQHPGRTRAREWQPAPVTLRDEKPVVLDPLEALVRLEEGRSF
jgi:hypothetical protein